MTIFDLLFIFLFLATIITLLIIVINMLCGRKHTALRILRILGGSLAAYFCVVVVVALAAPQKVLMPGQSRCFDEMCFTVTNVKIAPTIGRKPPITKAEGVFYLVTIQISCHGHGRAQSEGGVGASLIDAKGYTYEVSSAGQHAYEAESRGNPPLTTRVAPGENVSSVQVFDVPVKASEVALHIGHSGPGLFIIGDDESPLHKPTIIRLQP